MYADEVMLLILLLLSSVGGADNSLEGVSNTVESLWYGQSRFNDVDGENNVVSGSFNDVVGSKLQISGNSNSVSGSSNTVVGNLNSIDSDSSQNYLRADESLIRG